jgi:two-component system chemotaxis response regulator CheY
MPSVLIVDDAAYMRASISSILQEHGWEVVGEAENGFQGLELYRQLRPDVVTMDLTMPQMDGLTALRQIISEDSSARIVMCSAMGQQAMQIEAIQAGARDYVVKPFKPERLLDALNKSLST